MLVSLYKAVSNSSFSSVVLFGPSSLPVFVVESFTFSVVLIVSRALASGSKIRLTCNGRTSHLKSRLSRLLLLRSSHSPVVCAESCSGDFPCLCVTVGSRGFKVCGKRLAHLKVLQGLIVLCCICSDLYSSQRPPLMLLGL